MPIFILHIDVLSVEPKHLRLLKQLRLIFIFLIFPYGQASNLLSDKELRTFETDELPLVVASPIS